MSWRPLPPPTSFSEGQRAAYGCLVALAGIFAGGVCLGFIGIFFGGVLWKVWPPALYTQIVTILGYGFAGFIIAMICVIVTLAVGGPVGRFKGAASLQGGVNLDLGSNDSPQTMVQTQTTTTTASAPTPPKVDLP